MTTALENASRAKAQSDHGRILVVDDEEMNRDLLSRRLTRKGFEVFCAAGAAEADEQLEASSIDLILLDIMMPGVDGFEYLARVRERWDASQLPVIMATAKVGSDDVVRALQSGANDYVTKPLDFQVVLARVETHLRLKRTTVQLAHANQLLQDDLRRAARFQQSQLPAADLTVPGCRFAWSYLPCDALAGDFLNVIPLDESRTAFYVLDVSGHGTSAALMSAAVGRSLSVTHGESGVVAGWTSKGLMRGNRFDVVRPAEVTQRLNRQFEYDTREGKYFTIAYILVDVAAKEMTYTLAGHPPQILLPSQRKCQLLQCDGVPVGLLSGDDLVDDSFQQKTIPVQRDDRIYLFSDGVIEAENPAQEQFGMDRLCEVIEQSRMSTIEDSVSCILDTIRSFCGETPVDDDWSILAIEIAESETT